MTVLRRAVAVLCLAAMGLGLFQTGCVERNAEGRKVMTFMPSSMLTAQSTSAYAEQKKTVPISTDPRLNAIVKRVADRLIAQAEAHYGQYCRGFQWEVTLFDKPKTVNAYCMPGGKIGIYTGILPVCENEAALAAVMGHEISHALLKHGNERVSQQLGAAALLGLTEKVMKNKDVKSSKRHKILAILGLGAQFGFILPYSRRHENEADKLGMKLMAMAGYDPAEAPRLWRRMLEKSGASIPEFFSTHPSSAHRVQRLSRLLDEVRPLYDAAPEKYGRGEALGSLPGGTTGTSAGGGADNAGSRVSADPGTPPGNGLTDTTVSTTGQSPGTAESSAPAEPVAYRSFGAGSGLGFDSPASADRNGKRPNGNVYVIHAGQRRRR